MHCGVVWGGFFFNNKLILIINLRFEVELVGWLWVAGIINCTALSPHTQFTALPLPHPLSTSAPLRAAQELPSGDSLRRAGEVLPRPALGGGLGGSTCAR